MNKKPHLIDIQIKIYYIISLVSFKINYISYTNKYFNFNISEIYIILECKKIHILCLIIYSLYIKILVQIKKIQTPFIGDMVEFKKNFFFNIDIWLNCLSLFAIIIEKSM